MRVDVMPTHDVHSLYLRWEILFEGREKQLLSALGGPLVLEIAVSNFIDLSGVKHETSTIKVPIWPHAGRRNLGQSRFSDVDSRRHFWVNLQDAVGTTVVDWLHDARPGSVGKDGHVLSVPERAGSARVTPAPQPAP